MNRLLPPRTASAEPLDHDGRHRNWSHSPGVAGMAGKANETCTGQGGQRQEKSNLRVSDSVASPCCRALISLNLARAWELVPIPQSCLAHVSSNPTRRDLSLPTLFNNERYPAPNNSLTTEYLVSAVAWWPRVTSASRGLGLKSRPCNNETDVEGPCARRPMEAPLFSGRDRQGCSLCHHEIPQYSSLLSVTGVGLVDVV